MTKWNCSGTVTAGIYLGQVDADTEKEAIEKAQQLDTCSISVCNQCAEQIEDPEVTEVHVCKVDGESGR